MQLKHVLGLGMEKVLDGTASYCITWEVSGEKDGNISWTTRWNIDVNDVCSWKNHLNYSHCGSPCGSVVVLRSTTTSCGHHYLLTMAAPCEITIMRLGQNVWKCKWFLMSYSYIIYISLIYRCTRIIHQVYHWLLLRCMDCKTPTPLEQVRQFGKQHKCFSCHASYRYCCKNVDGWKDLTPDFWLIYMFTVLTHMSYATFIYYKLIPHTM